MKYTSGGQLNAQGSIGHEIGGNALVGNSKMKSVSSKSPVAHAFGGQVDLQGSMELGIRKNG